MSSVSASISFEEEKELKAARADVASLDRVLHKLVMTGDVKLPPILDKLLPRLLLRLKNNEERKRNCEKEALLRVLLEQIQTKLVEVLSHILKRVRGIQASSSGSTTSHSCPLPVPAILDHLLMEQDTEKTTTTTTENHQQSSSVVSGLPSPSLLQCPFTLNLSFLFVQLGLPQLSLVDQQALLPKLILSLYHTTAAAVTNTAKSTAAPAQLILQILFNSATATAATTTNTKRPTKPNPKAAATSTTTTDTLYNHDALSEVRRLLSKTTTIDQQPFQACLYDLCLDVFLNHKRPAPTTTATTTSTSSVTMIPPDGLSQTGHERLQQAWPTIMTTQASSSSTLNAVGVTPTALKVALLEAIAPTRVMCLFGPCSSSSSTAAAVETATTTTTQSNAVVEFPWTRTVALLVLASGDPDPTVSEPAQSYLKQFLDSHRYRSSSSRNSATTASSSSSSSLSASEILQQAATTTTSSNNHNNQDQPNNNTIDWNQPLLAAASLSLCLGQLLAESELLKNNNHPALWTTLGLFTNCTSSSSSPGSSSIVTIAAGANVQQQAILATKRRAVALPMLGTIVQFVATTLLEDSPTIFASSSSSSYRDNNNDDASAAAACAVGWLGLSVVRRTLLSSSADRSWVALAAGPRAKPYVAAARLLQALSLRLSLLLENNYYRYNDSDDNDNNGETENEQSKRTTQLLSLLAALLETACSCLETLTTSSTTTYQAPDASMTVRDYCYGAICHLCRSPSFAGPNCLAGYIFTKGASVVGSSQVATTTMTVSVETAKLLFACAVKELDVQRPRAVAALDALLAVYNRVYQLPPPQQQESMTTSQSEQTAITKEILDNTTTATDHTSSSSNNNNPWATAVSTVASTSNGGDPMELDDNTGSVVVIDRPALARSLLPLLWQAAQGYQPKSSRVAAARWSSELLRDLDLNCACHLLCFLAGDSDPTAASIAREGLAIGGSKTGNSSTNSGSATGGATTQSSFSLAVLEPSTILSMAMTNNDDGTVKFPDFGSFVEVLFPQHNKDQLGRSNASSSTSASMQRLQRYWEFSFQGKAATLRFCLFCLLHDLYGGEDSAVGLYLAALCETLSDFLQHGRTGSNAAAASTPTNRDAMDLLDECSFCLLTVLSSSKFARTQILSRGQGAALAVEATASMYITVEDLERLSLGAHSSRARRFLAGSCGALYKSWEPPSSESQTNSLKEWITSSRVDQALKLSATKLMSVARMTNTSGEQHGSAFLGSYGVQAFLQNVPKWSSGNKEDDNLVGKCWDESNNILVALGRGTIHVDEVLGNTCADCISIAFSYDGPDAPVLDRKLYQSSASLLMDLATALKKFGNGDTTVDLSRTTRLACASGLALAATSTGSGDIQEGQEASTTAPSVGLGAARITCVENLFSLLGSMSYRKEPEIGIIVGEALAAYADAYSPDSVVWDGGSQEVWPQEYSEEFAHKLAPHQHVLYTLMTKILTASNPIIRTSTAPALLAVVARAAKGVNTDPSYANRALVKEIKSHLPVVQQVFIQLLADPKSKHLCRESCCLGLAACRGLVGVGTDQITSSEELNHRLLRAFGQTQNFGGSAFMETPAQAAQRRSAETGDNPESTTNLMEQFGFESEVGGTSGMSEAALGAYREMAAASESLGRHDILYALLILSVSHPLWFAPDMKDRYSASSLLGESSMLGKRANTLEMQQALRPHLGKLLPRILRARHDPNKQTREQMSSLWSGLTGGGGDARQMISQHLLSCLDTLLEDASNKLWRARVGACGALAEIIVGREWEELGGGGPVLSDDDVYGGANPTAGTRFLRLWRVAMRSMDDVRGAVRDSGESLARGVRALTLRLSDPSMGEKSIGEKRGREEVAKHERNATAAAATALRWLVKHGLNQACPEGVGICVSTLAQIVGAVKPKILQPVLPELLRSLLLAMSGLEPAALNYLQLRTNDQDGLERLRLQVAQTGPLATAVTKCLDLVPGLDIETQHEIVPQLDTALRMSAGFATRVAVADAVSILCSTSPNAFKFTGLSSTNPSVRLLRAFYFAAEREHGQGTKDRLIYALGNLANLCPANSVRVLALRACQQNVESTGSRDDPGSRKAAAAALRAIAVRASHHFGDGGNGDIWRKRVLPVAFIGRKDPDEKIANLWKEVWEEGGAASHNADVGSVHLGNTLEEIILPFLVQECIRAIDDVSWSRRVSGAEALSELSALGVLSPLPRSTGNTPIPSIHHERARRRAQAAGKALESGISLLRKPRLWTGKASVLTSTVTIAGKWVSAEAERDADEQVLYGCLDNAKECPWKPISTCTSTSRDDLFLGDLWFQTSSLDDASPDESDIGARSSPRDDVDTQMNRANSEKSDTDDGIDFDSMENALPVEDQIETSSGSESSENTLSFIGFCRLLLNQALQTKSQSSSEEILPFRNAAFRGFRDLMGSLPASMKAASIDMKRVIYDHESSRLLSYLSEAGVSRTEAPVLVAGALSCLGTAFWVGIGEKGCERVNSNGLELAEMLRLCGGNQQPAWTVRESATLCMGQLAQNCHTDSLRQYAVISAMIDCASYSLKDKKFWKVRHAGIKLLRDLASRAGTIAERQCNEKQLILEAILPHKEDIQRLLRSSLGDSEAQVTALSTEVLRDTAWWP